MNQVSSIYDIINISAKKKSTQNIILISLIYKIIGHSHRDNIPLEKNKIDVLYQKYMDTEESFSYSEENFEQNKGNWDNMLKVILYDDLLLARNHFIDNYNYSLLFIMMILDILLIIYGNEY